MQRFETSYLTDKSVYTMTKNAFEKLKEIDRRSEEAVELEKRLKHWVEAGLFISESLVGGEIRISLQMR